MDGSWGIGPLREWHKKLPSLPSQPCGFGGFLLVCVLMFSDGPCTNCFGCCTRYSFVSINRGWLFCGGDVFWSDMSRLFEAFCCFIFLVPLALTIDLLRKTWPVWEAPQALRAWYKSNGSSLYCWSRSAFSFHLTTFLPLAGQKSF